MLLLSRVPIWLQHHRVSSVDIQHPLDLVVRVVANREEPAVNASGVCRMIIGWRLPEQPSIYLIMKCENP